jgi:hypothetical protein
MKRQPMKRQPMKRQSAEGKRGQGAARLDRGSIGTAGDGTQSAVDAERAERAQSAQRILIQKALNWRKNFSHRALRPALRALRQKNPARNKHRAIS